MTRGLSLAGFDERAPEFFYLPPPTNGVRLPDAALIAAGGCSLPAHSNVLSGASPVLRLALLAQVRPEEMLIGPPRRDCILVPPRLLPQGEAEKVPATQPSRKTSFGSWLPGLGSRGLRGRSSPGPAPPLEHERPPLRTTLSASAGARRPRTVGLPQFAAREVALYLRLIYRPNEAISAFLAAPDVAPLLPRLLALATHLQTQWLFKRLEAQLAREKPVWDTAPAAMQHSQELLGPMDDYWP
eukprot:scaffold6.g2812.t1